MPLPIAHGLIGASIIAASRPREIFTQKWKPFLVGAILGICPDFDLLIAWGLDLGDSWHGSFSHSIAFAVVTGLFVSMLMGGLNIKGVTVYGSAALSHALIDAATSKVWGAIKLFWPFSDRKVNFGLFDYFEFTPNLKTNPLIDDVTRALVISAYELLIFTPVFLLILFISRRVALIQGSRVDEASMPVESARD